MFETPADQHINELIETLCKKASGFLCSDEDREMYIEQIATLRASQNPTIAMPK